MRDRPVPVNTTELHWATLQEDQADAEHLQELVDTNTQRLNSIEELINKGETRARVTELEAVVAALITRVTELEKKPKK